MNVTVKVLCQLTIVLVAFLGHSVAKYSADSEFNDRENADLSFFETENYSEFTDDEIPSGVFHGDRGPVYYDREKRDTRGRARRSEEFQEEKKNKYEKEQDWNAEELQIEEGEDTPLEVLEDAVIDEDTKAELISRKTRSANQREIRYDIFKDDSIVEESRPPSREIREPKSNAPYEVHEFSEEGSDTLSSESAPPPAVLYHEGVQYVRAPNQHHHVVHGEGAPPLIRYSSADQAGAASKKKSRSSKKASGGSNDSNESYESAKGKKSAKGNKSAHHYEEANRGHEGRQKHAKSYKEKNGRKARKHQSSKHGGDHHEAAHGSKGGKFAEAKAHDRGHSTKGYQNKYQKDEYHKEHKFFDDYHKSGSHKKYGGFKGHHSKQDKGNYDNAHHDQISHQKHGGKKGQYHKGHRNEDHKAHKKQQGYKKNHENKSDYGKKGGHTGGNQYAYKSQHPAGH